MSAESSLTAVAVVRALLDEDTEGLVVLLPDDLPEPGRELIASLSSPALTRDDGMARRLAARRDVTQPAGLVTHRGQTPPIYDNLCQGGQTSLQLRRSDDRAGALPRSRADPH